jgi:hypothetical protein
MSESSWGRMKGEVKEGQRGGVKEGRGEVREWVKGRARWGENKAK